MIMESKKLKLNTDYKESKETKELSKKMQKQIEGFSIKYYEEMNKIFVTELKDKFIEVKGNEIIWSEKVRLRMQDRKDWECEKRNQAEQLKKEIQTLEEDYEDYDADDVCRMIDKIIK